ncbi:perlucin-like [Ylistrum balloti]|uniref:perlucin-like n=1 Tax=Ylistrum balloti TaxID=509963 RepID=UPI002905DBEC|nr:perlucin-like [Ylistrum balloti]
MAVVILYTVDDKDTLCGWYKFKSSYILFPTLKMSWKGSMAYCQLLGARLIETDTKQKDKFVRSIAKTIPGIFHVWTAGSDVKKEGKWVWMNSGLPIRTYENWQPGQPDNNSGNDLEAHCLALAPWFGYAWTDLACSFRGAAVCEISGV